MSGPELYEKRKRKGWTQAVLAAKLAVDRSTIQRWECGKTPIPEKMARLIHFVLTSKGVAA